ncbi:cytochrome c oxidase subunit 3 [uncultured Nonlabens sp.]|uniref:cytochrome c oxidase subunit 3 n=1 Tax=uncultured Nonlabens sp. TaxID=859306 RepID=UPI00261472C8|nr:cytochrome c oxidase subunit 3 [uncultured Nonlabens sp.]
MIDITQLPFKEKIARSKKQMMWFAIMSLTMMFAGLTSAYIISSSRRDWVDVDLPAEFFYSTGVILLSSLTLFLGKKALRSNNLSGAAILTFITFLLGTVFVIMQFIAFGSLTDAGIFFTGKGSSVAGSFIYIMVMAHLAHIVAGLISLTVITFKAVTKKYSKEEMLGFELGAIFWHFVDVLWIFLLLFLVFAKDIF